MRKTNVNYISEMALSNYHKYIRYYGYPCMTTLQHIT